jgi:hypothetical protein
MPEIYVGQEAIDRPAAAPAGSTYIADGALSGIGVITKVKVRFATDATGVYVGFGHNSGGNVWMMDTGAASLGDVTAGAERTFPGLTLQAAHAGDLLCIYCATGTLEATAGGDSYVSASAQNEVGDGSQYQFNAYNYTLSLYGTGVTPPAVTTQTPTAITDTSAIGHGNVTDDGGGITERFICWNTAGSPTHADNVVYDNVNATGSFIMNLINLPPGTLIHCKAGCINETGTVYGAEEDFTTNNTIGNNIMIF